MRGFALAFLSFGLILITAGPMIWGEDGHLMVGRVASEALPADMPDFFREAAAQLSYLNPEPDRWRDRLERKLDPAMNADQAPEHYINFELIPAHILDAPDRYAYLDSLHSMGIDPAGLLPFRILELTQRLRVGFRLWRAEEDSSVRRYIEERIINDAGILGHYVADGANPHHTSVHHNGWAEGYPNPHGFMPEPHFHGRFESAYVSANVTTDDVRAAVRSTSRVYPELRPAILNFLDESFGLLETLYELDQQESFNAYTVGADHHAFAVSRLARGSEMLRDLWWTAWITSETSMEE